MSTNVIVKYKVERPFTDKFTKEDITISKILEIDIERMKELNKHNIGRVVDIIVEEDTNTNEKITDNKEPKETKEKYTKEQLEALTVNDLKDLAEKMQIELTKAKKDEIIEEILENQK